MPMIIAISVNYVIINLIENESSSSLQFQIRDFCHSLPLEKLEMHEEDLMDDSYSKNMYIYL